MGFEILYQFFPVCNRIWSNLWNHVNALWQQFSKQTTDSWVKLQIRNSVGLSVFIQQLQWSCICLLFVVFYDSGLMQLSSRTEIDLTQAEWTVWLVYSVHLTKRSARNPVFPFSTTKPLAVIKSVCSFFRNC